jgi:hypothetical protein
LLRNESHSKSGLRAPDRRPGLIALVAFRREGFGRASGRTRLAQAPIVQAMDLSSSVMINGLI